MKEVGTIKELNLYPVKSMAVLPVETAQLYWYGLNGDRKYAFVQKDKADASGFPWLTARQLPDLLRYRTAFNNPAEPMGSVLVTTPTGERLELSSSEILKRLESAAGTRLSLLKLNRGTHDVAPISIITTGTTTFIAEQLKSPFDLRCLRMNLVLEASESRLEESWLGKTLVIGEAELHVQQRDKRCVMVNLDADTGEHTPDLLKMLAQKMNACAGVYANVAALGKLSVGDKVFLRD